MYEMSKRDSRRKVERSGESWGSIARAKGKEAKEGSDRSKIKKERRKHTESECICPYTAKMSNETYGRERRMVREVSSSTCMTRG